MSHPLDQVNTSELVEMCRNAGIGNFGRNTPREELYEALEEGTLPKTCPLEEKRSIMEKHIKKNYRRLRTQLPGCDGKCRSFGCPDIIVQRCWTGFEDDII